jgi:iron complex outermembrane recepter protein
MIFFNGNKALRLCIYFLFISLIYLPQTCHLSAQELDKSDPEITQITINSSPFEVSPYDLNASARVIEQVEIERRSLFTLQDSISSIPGLQWSAGSSMPRFFQIRGIGELEQYQGAPNPSVGMIIDDIDYSGIGAIVPFFDIDQIEVLKGPQGIRYGSSALAGVINMHSTDPSSINSAKIETRFGNDSLHSGSFAVGGALPETGDRLQLRISSSHTHQDGFRDNLFLNRNDTNERDLHTTRVKIKALISDKLTANLTTLFVDNNNGFDAFSIDNSLNTQSDKPGADQVESRAAALNLNYVLSESKNLKSITTFRY